MASAFRILGEGQLSLTKFLLVTDRHVDLKDFPATLEHILARTNPETDLYIFSNLSMDTLDYTGPEVNHGSKGVWLGLGDPVRELPRAFTGSELPQGVFDVQVFCGGCLVVGAPSRQVEPNVAARIASHSLWPSMRNRRAWSSRQQHDQFPLDDFHSLRAGGRHPCKRNSGRTEPFGLYGADHNRRPAQDGIPERTYLSR